jgi:hypothetical protein
MAPKNLQSFTRLAGIPIHYARAPSAPYGTRGKPRKVRLAGGTRERFESCFAELREIAGKPDCIVSGGCYVNKPGRHGQGRAMDIDSIWWPGWHVVTKVGITIRYLGVEAVLRRHFGTVLNYDYNRAHQDHWHVDDGRPVGYAPRSRAQTVFVQQALNILWGKNLLVDGKTGPKTTEALMNAYEDVKGDTEIWLDFLGWVAKEGLH